MPSGWKSSALKTMLVLAWAYFGLLFGWGVASSLWGDDFWWLFILNAFAVFLFVPLPLALVAGFYGHRKSVWIPAILGSIWAGVLFGPLFLPKSGSPQSGQKLTVMTFNVLGYNHKVDPVLQSLKESDADVIAIYELNPLLAAALGESLSELYPYQQLDPQEGVTGSGVISRFPLKPTGEQLPSDWMGKPQLLSLDFNGTAVTILCAHPFASNLRAPSTMQRIIQAREQQALTIKDYVETHPGPLVMPLDFNATPQNSPYKIVTTVLKDAWPTAGWGLGHTFPGSATPGSSRPRLGGIPVPMWLVRIDYVFHSHHFTATNARFGPWDGNSDHRPVIAELILVEE